MHPGSLYDSILNFSFPSLFSPGNLSPEVNLSDTTDGGDGQVFSIWKNDTLIEDYELAPTFDPKSHTYVINMNNSDTVYLRHNKGVA